VPLFSWRLRRSLEQGAKTMTHAGLRCMITRRISIRFHQAMLAAALGAAAIAARADVVTDWNERACDATLAAGLSAPVAVRTMAIVQTAVFGAVNTITQRYPTGPAPSAGASDASLDAAVAAATHATLGKLLPAPSAALESAYEFALAAGPGGVAQSNGVALGEEAAAAVLAAHAEDGAEAPETYRPRTAAGVYVPTIVPAVPQWPSRKPWVLASADQFRPGPPPALDGEVWARDYNEIKALGAKRSTTRTAEQTEIARFWEATGPAIYFPLARSVANASGREITRNARLLAAAGQAMDDALVAVMDAKYHYEFWRPITAIRNGDIDGNAATERDAGWVPFIDTPMHPEYPCAHCTIAAALGAVLRADIGSGSMMLSATSFTAPGVTRTWTSIDALVHEVESARVYDGVHYRTSSQVGSELGRQVGELVAAKLLMESN
jgi:hypothetical protein